MSLIWQPIGYCAYYSDSCKCDFDFSISSCFSQCLEHIRSFDTNSEFQKLYKKMKKIEKGALDENSRYTSIPSYISFENDLIAVNSLDEQRWTFKTKYTLPGGPYKGIAGERISQGMRIAVLDYSDAAQKLFVLIDYVLVDKPFGETLDTPEKVEAFILLRPDAPKEDLKELRPYLFKRPAEAKSASFSNVLMNRDIKEDPVNIKMYADAESLIREANANYNYVLDFEKTFHEHRYHYIPCIDGIAAKEKDNKFRKEIKSLQREVDLYALDSARLREENTKLKEDNFNLNSKLIRKENSPSATGPVKQTIIDTSAIEQKQSELDKMSEICEKLKKEAQLYKEMYEAVERRWRPMRLSEIPEWVNRSFKERLVLLPTASKMLQKADGGRKIDVSLLCSAIEYLACEFWDIYVGKISNEDCLNQCSKKYDRTFRIVPIQDSIIRAYPNEYTAKYQKQTIKFDMHLCCGNTPETGIRIYFHCDVKNKKLIIGSLPDHLSGGKG